jgi:hypothetical protein
MLALRAELQADCPAGRLYGESLATALTVHVLRRYAVFPAKGVEPQRVIHAFNRPNRENVELFTFSWVDIKDARPVDSRAYAFLNDAEYVIPTAVFDALRNYDVRPVPWSERDGVREELAA